MRATPGELQCLIAVAVDAEGDGVVADGDNHWVSIFCPEGKFKMKIRAGYLTGPQRGHHTVADEFSLYPSAQWHFVGPQFVNKKAIVVKHFQSRSVRVYSTSGEFLFKFGSCGSSRGLEGLWPIQGFQQLLPILDRQDCRPSVGAIGTGTGHMMVALGDNH